MNVRLSLRHEEIEIETLTDKVSDDLLTDIRRNKEHITAYLKKGLSGRNFEHIERISEGESYAVSSAQRRLWVLSQLEGASVAYHIPGVYEFRGRLDQGSLRWAFDRLVERHEVLRTVIREGSDGEPRQVILGAEDERFGLKTVDAPAGGREELEAVLEAEALRPFDLSAGPLLRATLYALGSGRWVLQYVMHHIISDGWSMGILIRELLLLYNRASSGQADALVPLRIQYKDYAAWQQGQLRGSRLNAHRGYWLRQLRGELPVLELPTDRPRPLTRTYQGGMVVADLPAGAVEGLQALGQQEGATLFMTLLTAVNVLLYRYCHQEDIIVGSPVAGREHADLEGQIGFYLNTLALRTRLSGTDSFRSLLSSVRQLTLEAYEHQVYPFDALLEDLHLQHDLSRHPLFDVLIDLHDQRTAAGEQLRMGGMEVKRYGADLHRVSKFALTFLFTQSDAGLTLALEFNSDLFSRSMAERLHGHFCQLVTSALSEPDQAVGELSYIGAAEEHQLLESFQGTAGRASAYRPVLSLFEQAVKAHPEAEAVAGYEGGLTYAELDERSGRLARYLVEEYGVKRDDLVAILVDRSPKLLIALLGIWKAGAAYVPIDTVYPKSRKEYILQDSGAQVLLTQTEYMFDLSFYGGHIFAMDVQLDTLDTAGGAVADLPGADHLAYVIYTSGSTGFPKGCTITHGNVSQYIQWANGYYFSGVEGGNFGLFTSLSFDLTVTALFCPLTRGGRLFVYPQQEDLASMLRHSVSADSGIDAIKLTPSHIHYLSDLGLCSTTLRCAIVGGEELTEAQVGLLKAINPEMTVYNEYGPTEATVGCVVSAVQAGEPVIIGQPIAGSEVLILDDRLGLCAIGVRGEICIGGPGLASGYLNRWGLTAEKFIDHPYRSGQRLYRTGDGGKWLPDGKLVFCGRSDDQVKLRGFRVELGEIERHLQGLSGIESAVVIVREREEGEKELIAYVVSGEPLNSSDIRLQLSRLLPAYMWPSQYVQLDKIPLTANGKADRKRLPDADGTAMSSGVRYEAPRNPIEEKLAVIWQEVLGKERVGVKDNFFALGGHSLKATRLVSQIHRQFEVRLELKDLFTIAVLEDQAQLIAKARKKTFVSIPRVEDQGSYVLSASQRRLWVLSQFEQANRAYNVPGAYVFDGELDREALGRSVEALIERHESLRTVFREDEKGEVRQHIMAVGEQGFGIDYQDLRGEQDREERARELVQATFTEPFDLARGPLVRAGLYRIDDKRWIFTYTMHHIISDGWSIGIWIRELLRVYRAFAAGEVSPLEPLRIQSRDYAAWQQQQLNDESLQGHKQYWLKQFDGELPVTDLAGDRPRPALKSYRGGVISRKFGPEITQGIKILCQEQDSTLFMGLLAAVNVLLYRYTGQEDLIVGTSVAGRDHVDLEDQIGCYLNTLALRTRFSGSDNFRDLLHNTRQITLGAFDHQAYPFDELVNELHLRRDTSRHPLFDVAMVIQNMENRKSAREQDWGNLVASGYHGSQQVISKFDLFFSFAEYRGDVDLSLEYNEDIYDAQTVERMTGHLERLLVSIIEYPSLAVNKLSIFTGDEERLLLAEFNNTAADYPTTATLYSLFERQVQETPAAKAVVFGETELGYLELKEQADRLARYLKSIVGVKPGEPVAFMLERSDRMIVTMLGILAAGAVFVPVDPDYPALRKENILKDTGCRVLISRLDFIKGLSSLPEHHLDIDGLPETVNDLAQAAEAGNYSSDLAYIIYTSGSTGTPKGVMIEHRAIVNTVCWQRRMFDLKPGNRCLQFAPATFDASIWDIFATLTSGATLYVVSEEVKSSAMQLEQYIADNRIEIATLPPAYVRMMNLGRISGLKKLITAGEAAQTESAREFQRYGQFYNAYGPTESSICATIFRMEEGVDQRRANIPIGRPIANTRIYITDGTGNLKPIGTIGEICIGGAGLARGYWKNPVLTQEKFIADPLRPGERIYKTGDLGRWLPDGNIEFIGRKDSQVKIRGCRVELQEIETAVLQYPGVQSAAVVARRGKNGDNELVAYIVAGSPFDRQSLIEHLASSLPSFMLPTFYVPLQSLPLTDSGKLDRSQLPDPDAAVAVSAGHVLPRNELEEKLTAIWQDILGVDLIDIRDNFFDLGGHSLKAMRMLTRIHREFGVKLRLNELFNKATIEDLGKEISRHNWADNAKTDEPVAADETNLII